MHLRFDITISFLDVFILAYLAYSVWLGYKTGAIVKAMSLFALSAGLLVSSAATFLTYRYFYNISISPEIFAAFVLMVLFGLTVWFAEYIQKVVYNQTKDVALTKTSKILGAIFAFIKSYIIVAVFSLVLLSFNVSGRFLPDTEARSFFANVSEWSLSSLLRMLRPLHCTIQATYESEISPTCKHFLPKSLVYSKDLQKNKNKKNNNSNDNNKKNNSVNPNKQKPISPNTHYKNDEN